ncbi:CDC27 family protein [Vagococcus vulneris]|uniref:Uncharacterized protein n=1 Tax=Vagococcus vulneris TaxID=1977869 RepID=A0A429ZZ99_9ENTE|nr:CDC27 family protein [Vagococcus vulneris]RST99323.1 hypothetical protein CBF37_04970 [Vagococcus vulneris]
MSYSKKMLEALSEGNLIAAEEQFDMALLHDLPEEKYQLAAYLFELGFLDESEKLYLDLLTKEPEEDSIKISLAEIAIENGETAQASDWLSQIDSTSDVYVQSLLTQADLYQQLEIPEVSEQKLSEAKAILPEEPIIDAALAELYFSIEDYSRAITFYERLYQTDLSDVPLTINPAERLGVSLSRSGNFEEAITYLEEAVAEQKTSENQFQLALTYYQLEEIERTIELLQGIKESDEDFMQAYYPLAQVLVDEGRYAESEEVVIAGIDKNPYDINLYHLASLISYQLGDVVQSKNYLNQAIALEEDSDFSKLKLAELLLKEESFDEVIELIGQLDNQGQGYAQWYLAQAYNGIEEFDNAAKAYDSAQAELTEEADFSRDYGLFLREEGKINDAKRWLNHYLEMIPDDIEVAELLQMMDGD